jgi:hypothetical protein
MSRTFLVGIFLFEYLMPGNSNLVYGIIALLIDE